MMDQGTALFLMGIVGGIGGIAAGAYADITEQRYPWWGKAWVAFWCGPALFALWTKGMLG